MSSGFRKSGWRQGFGAAVVLLAAGSALAQTAPAPTTLSWRQTSVLAERRMEGGAPVTVRRGVAVFADGEPATITVRLLPSGRPVDGRMTVVQEMRYRFEDGSTFAVRGAGTPRVNPDGSPIPGEVLATGDVIEGSGRFAGITGTYTMRSRTDLPARADGMLGDYFGDAQATVTIRR
jgi:hypothetical protein